MERTNNEPDSPDILIAADTYTFLEEKSSLPKDVATLELKIEEVLGYVVEHSFENKKFVPQVILLCPDDVYEERSQTLRKYSRELAIVVYPASVEDPFALNLVQGKVSDQKIASILKGSDQIPHARTVYPAIKFLSSPPPVPYSTFFIWQVIWNYAGTSHSDFKVEYSAILKQCKSFYPSWQRKDVEQITYGRLNDALELLSYLEWVEYEGKLSNTTKITVRYSKGDRLRSSTLDYFIKKYIEMKSQKEKKSTTRKSRKPVFGKVKRRGVEGYAKMEQYIGKS